MDSSSTTVPAVETAATQLLETDKASAQKPTYSKEKVSSSKRYRVLTDIALNFLSNASNETLGACAIGLCASTYLILGRVGLVLLGALGGIVLQATWEGSEDVGKGVQEGSQKSASRRRELGVEVAKRLLDWNERRNDIAQSQGEEETALGAPVAAKSLDYSDFRPATAAALTDLTEAIIRDYVTYVQRNYLAR